jgi:hypothetical protein
MKVLIDIHRSELEKYPYISTPLSKVYFPRVDEDQPETMTWDDFGITDSYFGGNIHQIAKIKTKPYYIISDRHRNTLGILHRFEELEEHDKNELSHLCDIQGIKYDNKTTKQQMVELLTSLRT